jgi:hypothetical protein
MSSNMAPDMRDMIDRFSRQGADGIGLMVVRRAVAFMGMLFIGAVFSTLGGLLGAVVFRRRVPPGTVDIPTS